VRGLILAAGYGTRLGALSDLRPKPAVPVRGLPVIAYLLELLHAHEVREVMINLHHLPEELERAVERHTPPGTEITYSLEREILGTGGGIRRAAGFLQGSDESIVLAGDMLLDVDLSAMVRRHRARGDRVTLLLRDDPRRDTFGTIGVDAQGCVRRIGSRFDLGGEANSGVFVGVRVFSARAYGDLPQRESFEDLGDWIAPALAAGARDIRAEVQSPRDCTWEPVGTLHEYLQVNLEPPELSYLSAEQIGAKGRARIDRDLVIGAGARLGSGSRLERAVGWEGESVPAGLVASDGVFAGGTFHSLDPRSIPRSGDHRGATE